MATRIASGQITIVDLNDGKAVQSYTTSSQGDTQIYNPDEKSFQPDYTKTPYQVVTAHVYVTGNSTDQAPLSACTGWAWTIDGATVKTGTDISVSGNVLTIKKNITAGTKVMNIRWACTFVDPETLAETQVMGYKTLNQTQSGGTLAVVQIQTPKGDTFDAGNKVTQLTAVAKLWRGTKQDTEVKSMTWEKLDIASGSWKSVSSSSYTTSGGVSTLTVVADDVLNFQTFRCTVVDDDGTFSEIVTFMDATDPYTVEVFTLTGDKIVNGAGNAVVHARVWRGAELVEDENSSPKKFVYTWTKYNRTGQLTNWYGTSSSTTTGNPITVSNKDVDVKATILCEVTMP